MGGGAPPPPIHAFNEALAGAAAPLPVRMTPMEAEAHTAGHRHSHFGTLAESTGAGVRALRIGIAGLAATTVLQLAREATALLADAMERLGGAAD